MTLTQAEDLRRRCSSLYGVDLEAVVWDPKEALKLVSAVCMQIMLLEDEAEGVSTWDQLKATELLLKTIPTWVKEAR